MTKEVRLEYDGPIATITNDNVDKHNAFDDDMDQQLFAVLAELKERPDVRAVIWRGEGKSFSSGRDVGAIGGGDVELTHHELMARGHRGILQVFDIEAPIIVAMHGWSIGASFQRALLCDIRIAAEGARFSMPFVDLALVPEAASSLLLPRMAGRRRAARYLLLGEAFGSEEALAIGIASHVVEPSGLEAALGETVKRLLAKPPGALRATQKLLRKGTRDEILERMQLESQQFAERLESPEAKQAITAFFESRGKRPG